MDPITYYNRHTGRMETEAVYGEGFLRWTYGTPLGALALHGFVKRRFFSAWYGSRMDTPESARRIEPFIAKYKLDRSEFLDAASSYGSFNDFFYRRLKPEARPIDPDPQSIVFPADGRHLGFSKASEIAGVFVKGQRFDLGKLLGDDKLASRYADGTLVLSRLCPVDYHRYHFPVAGTVGNTRLINGPLFSVSPIALRRKLSYLWQNKRTITPLQTPSIGTVLCLEIGATCVGSIQQTFHENANVAKGDEKGYFAFGGSSTITIFEPGSVTLDHDLMHHSSRQTELYARVGSRMGRFA